MTPPTMFHRRSLLGRLTAVQRARLLGASSKAAFAKGETIFRQGEPAEAVWLLLEGWVHLVRSDGPAAGSGVVIFTITPEEALCGLSAIDHETYNIGAVAATPCRMMRVSAAAFNEALAQSAPFAGHVLRLCVRRMRHIAQQYGSMAEPVSRRIIRALLRLREQFGDAIPVTHRELGQMAWTSTETAIRTVRQLKRHGQLDGARGKIQVRDGAALERVLAKPAAQV